MPTTDIVVTSSQPIAVLGATGNQGGHVARALLDAGWQVRAITRNPESPRARTLAHLGAELVPADMGEVDTLIRAVKGTHGIFSVQNFWELGLREEVRLGTNVIDAARAVGGPHLIYGSGLGAEQPRGVPAIDGKAILEERLRESGLPFTILRSALFMDDFRGASLPFPPMIQRLLKAHRLLVGRLFLSVLRDSFPHERPVPLTTLGNMAQLAVWGWKNQRDSLGNAYAVVGDLVPPKALCTMWSQATGQRIPIIPGIRMGLRLGVPQMARLLAWLSRNSFAVTGAPLHLHSYQEWLHSTVRH